MKGLHFVICIDKGNDKLPLSIILAKCKELNCDYAVILHDKDEAIKHYHVYLNLRCEWNISAVSDYFGIACVFVNCVDNVSDEFVFLYFLHYGSNFGSRLIRQSKYQLSDIYTNMKIPNLQ